MGAWNIITNYWNSLFTWMALMLGHYQLLIIIICLIMIAACLVGLHLLTRVQGQ